MCKHFIQDVRTNVYIVRCERHKSLASVHLLLWHNFVVSFPLIRSLSLSLIWSCHHIVFAFVQHSDDRSYDTTIQPIIHLLTCARVSEWVTVCSQYGHCYANIHKQLPNTKRNENNFIFSQFSYVPLYAIYSSILLYSIHQITARPTKRAHPFALSMCVCVKQMNFDWIDRDDSKFSNYIYLFIRLFCYVRRVQYLPESNEFENE